MPLKLQVPHPGPEEAQGLQRFWPLHHLALESDMSCNVFTS